MIESIRLAAGAIFLTVLAAAQGPTPRMMMRMYAPATETTIKGTVQEVKTMQHGRMMMSGTHLIVKTDNQTQEVMLGPSNFVASKGFTFAKGDSIELTGSKVTMMGQDYIVAREVTKDGKTLTLRDKTGKPEWAGTMMGGGMGRSMDRGMGAK